MTDESEAAEKITALIRRTEKKNPAPADVDLLRKWLEVPGMWRVVGDLGRYASDALIHNIAGQSTALYESVRVGQREMCKDLGYQSAPAMERMLIEHVVLCWLCLQKCEYNYAHVDANQETTLTRADFWSRKLSATQRRYLRAVETLARIRRLALPAVQVNIGDKQVNVVAGGSPAER